MITNKKHNKHTKLIRPNIGTYARCEVGILGAGCDRIRSIVTDISHRLSANAKICYIDADHSEADQPIMTTLTDGINHHRLTYRSQLDAYEQKAIVSKNDITIVNCNHFSAQTQIVCCTLKKKESLSRKLDKLTDLKVILLDDSIDAPFDFLDPIVQKFNPLVLSMSETDKIADFVLGLYQSKRPQINALIMAGGKSQRMGQDKGMIDYHGKPQWQHMADLTNDLGMDSYISCRSDQAANFDGYNTLTDTFLDLGPYGAILSAFRSNPNAAWMTIACDLPLLTSKHLSTLIEQVDYSAAATSYHNPDTGWPEPMVTIWMPKAYPELLKFLSLGYSCPRKVLINTEVHQIHVEDTTFLHNANTPEDRSKAIQLLS